MKFHYVRIRDRLWARRVSKERWRMVFLWRPRRMTFSEHPNEYRWLEYVMRRNTRDGSTDHVPIEYSLKLADRIGRLGTYEAVMEAKELRALGG